MGKDIDLNGGELKGNDSIKDDELGAMIEDVEIEEELKQEEKLRKKNSKITLISVIGLITIGIVYFGINYYNALLEENNLVKQDEFSAADKSTTEGLPPQKEMNRIDASENGDIQLREPDLKSTSLLPTQEESIQISEPDDSILTPEREPEVSILYPDKDVPAKKPEFERKVDRKIEKNKKEKKPAQVKKAVKTKKVAKEKKAVKKLKPQKTHRKKSMPPALEQIPETDRSGKYYIQLGIFVVKQNAEELVQSLKMKGFSPSTTLQKQNTRMYRVFSGEYKSKKKAKKELAVLSEAGIKAVIRTVSRGVYTMHTGSFFLKENAELLKNKVTKLGYESKIVKVSLAMDAHKVILGRYKTKNQAESMKQKLGKHGFPEAVVLKG